MENALQRFAARLLALGLSAWVAGCASNDSTEPRHPPEKAPRASAAADAGQPVDARAEASPEAAAPEPSQAPAGADFIEQARFIFRVVACAGDEPLPARASRKVVQRHCKKMRRYIKRYRRRFADPAAAFIATLRPPSLPTRVVYPFGGGDLSTALVTYPDATEITTISLEAAGDPRLVDHLGAKDLERELNLVGDDIRRLLAATHSTTKSLQESAQSKLAGTVAFALTALAIHGYEPVSLRYFAFEPDGSLRYLTEEAIHDLEADFGQHAREMKEKERVLRKKKLQVWKQQVAVFANMELTFRKQGAGDDAPVRVYRHVVANLDNPHLADDPRVLEHLKKKGKIAAMTKAASYLLWMDEFSTIRNYLLEHMVWMISDSSGIPPSLSAAAGFEVIPYGQYNGPYFYYKGRTSRKFRKELERLWKRSSQKNLPFCYGYPDSTRKGHHLMVTRPRQSSQ